MKTCGVYSITAPNGKQYIGSSSDITARWKQHRKQLSNVKHANVKLSNSVNKYGLANFKFEILDECSSENQFKLEQMYLDKFKPALNMSSLAALAFHCTTATSTARATQRTPALREVARANAARNNSQAQLHTPEAKAKTMAAICKPVISDQGEAFESASAAALSLGLNSNTVATSIKERSRAGGRYWQFGTVYDHSKQPVHQGFKPVVNDKDQTFDTGVEASLSLGLARGAVGKSVPTGIRAGKMYWQFGTVYDHSKTPTKAPKARRVIGPDGAEHASVVAAATAAGVKPGRVYEAVAKGLGYRYAATT